jgi:phosphate transport system permease protein
MIPYKKNYSTRKKRSQTLLFALFSLMSYSVIGILVLILGFIIVKGIGVINWEFISTAPEEGMKKVAFFLP